MNDDAKSLIAGLSDGYPHFIQQFAFSAFNADTDNVIDRTDVIEGTFSEHGALHQLGERYLSSQYFKEIRSDEYRKVLKVMSESLDSPMTKSQIRKLVGMNETTLNNAMKALSDKGIILKDSRRRASYRLPTASFAVWIKVMGQIGESSARPT